VHFRVRGDLDLGVVMGYMGLGPSNPVLLVFDVLQLPLYKECLTSLNNYTK
jgi:hypothetical protein